MIELFAIVLLFAGLFLALQIGALVLHLIFLPIKLIGGLLLGIVTLPFLLLAIPAVVIGGAAALIGTGVAIGLLLLAGVAIGLAGLLGFLGVCGSI